MKACTPSVVQVLRHAAGVRWVGRSHQRDVAGLRGTRQWRGIRPEVLCISVLICALAFGPQEVQGQSLLNAPQVRSLSSRSRSREPNALSRDQLARALRSRAAEPNEPNEIAPPDRKRLQETEKPSRLELLLSRETPVDVYDVSLHLKQFGYDVFRTSVTTFAPVTNVPVGPDYVIGPGDNFTLTLWGRIDAQHTLRVDRDGQIILPEVGALKVWGMKFSELDDFLRHELSRKYTDFKMSITMDRLRTIHVLVSGEASSPGTYTISSLSTIFNALCAAGGPSKNGTLRKIRLLRGAENPVEIDLYSFLVGGDKSKDLRLQDGDTLFIPLIGPVVGVAGSVKRPAIYEMTEPMTLRQVLEIAGGATFAGWLQRVQVERVENHERHIAVDFNMSRGGPEAERPAAGQLILQDGDIVKVFGVAPREEKVLYLKGHAVRPGKYEWKPGMRLRDILTSYDVLQPQPHLGHGEIVRLVPPDLHPTTLPFNLAQLLAGDQSQNIELAQYDTIRVFRWDERTKQAVTVSGMVFDPNDYRLVPDMRVSDLIDAAGGLQKNAYLRTAEVSRSHVSQDGMTTEKIDIDLEKALAGDPENDILLHDYDHLVVRPVPDLKFGQTVEIAGEVRFPGTYPIRKNETLSSLIERAGGYTDRAYLRGAVFTRESAKEVQSRRLDEMIRQIEESTLSSAQKSIGGALDAETAKAQQAALEAKKELLAKLRAAEITGRVVIRLATLEEFRRSKYDIELEDKDKLEIPQTPGVVHVIGEVFNPTSLLYESGGMVSYYLHRVGGTTKEADKKQLSVIKADGSVISIQQNRGRLVFWDPGYNRWSFGGFMSHRLEPGDTIVVPRKIDRYFWLRTTKDITQIIFQIAVAAGVVLAI